MQEHAVKSMISVQIGLAFRSQYLENDIKTHGFGDITTNLKTCRGLGLKIMNSVYFQKNYKTNISKNYTRPDSKPPPGLKIMKTVHLNIYHERNLLQKQAQTRFETAPGLENHEIRIF